MFTSDTLAAKADAILIEKTEPRLKPLLAKHGASDFGDPPRALQSQLLQRALLETAAANFPSANLEILKHSFRSFDHPAFATAVSRMKIACMSPGDAFEFTSGVHAAVVLAGYGLPVAPFDLATMCIRAKPSNDIETVLDLFSRDKDAYVGYSSCKAPIYILLTDCIRSLRRVLPTHPRLAEVSQLFARTGPVPAARPWTKLRTRMRHYRPPAERCGFDGRAA